jgi:hypothetical protein
VESSYEFGIEPSGSIKCWELSSGLTSNGLSSCAQLHGVSYNKYYDLSGQSFYRNFTVSRMFWE